MYPELPALRVLSLNLNMLTFATLGALLCLVSPIYSACYNLHGNDVSKWPDTGTARTLQECPGNGMCCFEDQQCLTDLKLCQGGRYSSGLTQEFCTDPDWPEESCSLLCRGVGDQIPLVGTRVVACGDGTYCCGYRLKGVDDSKACCSENRGFKIDVSGIRVDSMNSTTESVSATASTSSASSTRVPTSSTSSSAPTSSDTAPAAVSDATASTPAASDTTPSDLSMGSRVGIGAGSCVGAALVTMGLMIYLRERSRRKRIEMELVQTEARVKPELDGKPAGGHNLGAEMYLTPPSELGAYGQLREGLQNHR